MADLQPGVPQCIKDRLGDRLAPGGLLVGQQEQQIDVGAGRLQPTAIAAGGDHRHMLGLGRILRRVEMLAHELEQNTDDLVFHLAQPLGAATAMTILEQKLFRLGAAFDQRRLEPLRQRRAQFDVVAGSVFGELFEIGDDGAAVDQLGRRPGGGSSGFGRIAVDDERGHGAIGIAEAGL